MSIKVLRDKFKQSIEGLNSQIIHLDNNNLLNPCDSILWEHARSLLKDITYSLDNRVINTD